jgi:hypothetical protein
MMAIFNYSLALAARAMPGKPTVNRALAAMPVYCKKWRRLELKVMVLAVDTHWLFIGLLPKFYQSGQTIARFLSASIPRQQPRNHPLPL